MPTIGDLRAREVLDSRGIPTVEARCALVSGAVSVASVPSGRSTGANEAVELRDGDAGRYRGLGCLRAVANVEGELRRRLVGLALDEDAAAAQRRIDAAMVELDGTEEKSRLGANAVLAVSIAFARAFAAERGVALYEHFGELARSAAGGGAGERGASGELLGRIGRLSSAGLAGSAGGGLPRLTVNLFSGGKHAGGQVAIQDVLVVPVSAGSVDESLAMVHAVYYAAAEILAERFGARLLRADEGGLAPECGGAEGMIGLAVEAIGRAGLVAGEDAALAIDVAATHFHREGRYFVDGKDREGLDASGMIERVAGWVRDYPVVSVEDGLAEEDWKHWAALREALGGRALTLGDDLLCTNGRRIGRAVESGACDALLLKVNQVGTLSEAAEALGLARGAGWAVTVSARSGETEDDWLADLAVGWGADQIKVGSITQSERLAKYNRLLAIECSEPLHARQ